MIKLKKIFSAALLSVAVLTSSIAVPMPAQAAASDWNLVWSDEFNKTPGTGVDTSKWVYETGFNPANSEKQYYTDRTDNVVIEQDPNIPGNGLLDIKSLKENYGGAQYTSGRIITKDKFSIKYGKVEMRAKLPYGQGIWPAFWMLGDDIFTSTWPFCGEIDIMEYVGSTPTKIYSTIHGPAYNGGGGLGGYFENAAGFSNDWHTYAVEWDPESIRFYFDGKMFQERTPDDLTVRNWVFDHTFFILLNTAVGGDWPGDPDATTVFPQKYLIDYVRVYQREGNAYPIPAARDIRAVKSVALGKYAGCNKYGNDIMTADKGSYSTWEMYEKKDLGNGNIALINLADYKYVSAVATGARLYANQGAISSYETFQLVTNSDGTQSLKCLGNNKYVTTDAAGILTATASSIGNNEKFILEKYTRPDNSPKTMRAEAYAAKSSGLQLQDSYEGGKMMGNFYAGDYIDYNVDVPAAGTYQIKYRVSSPYSDPDLKLQLKNSAGVVLDTVNIPQTGDWQVFQTVTSSVTLPAGTQTLRIYSLKNGWDFYWANIDRVAPIEAAEVPRLSPAGGTYSAGQQVTISCLMPGTTIRYTTNGLEPTASSPIYTGPITLTKPVQIKAKGFKTGKNDSYSASEVYYLNVAQQVAAPTVYPAAGSYSSIQVVELNCATPYATIRYTLDGSTPTASSPVFTTPIVVSSTTTIKAKAFAAGMTDSAAATATYTLSGIQSPTPAVSPSPTPTPAPLGPNLALNKNGTASSGVASMAFDGNAAGTRWESAHGVDPQWIYVDLGSSASISRVKLNWETASAKAYKVQVSNDAANWTDVYSTAAGAGGIETISFTPTNARYVRMYGTQRNTIYGYSLWEFEVYGSGVAPTATPTPTATPAPTTTPTSTATPRPTVTPTPPAGTNLALNKTGAASSGFAVMALDGNAAGTRWESIQGVDPQWIYVDLGSAAAISRVKLNWETASAKAYKIQVSNDAANWTDVYSTTTGAGGIETITITPTSARYVRMYGTQRNTTYGYSLWEFEVY